jgi:hypothetical protein
MLADELDYVLGVDTHRDEHVLAVVTAPAGALVAGAAAPATARGYRELLRVAEQHAPGRRAWAIEGTGSYGAGLARYLHARGESVLEVSRIPRGERRLRGKDDALDAARTARAALAAASAAEAQQIATGWLARAHPGEQPAGVRAFPGYFTIDTTLDGKPAAMLSVNQATGAVWYHGWHGAFLAVARTETRRAATAHSRGTPRPC